MEDINFAIYLQYLIGLIAIINPFGFLPVFYSMTDHQYEADRLKTAKTTTISVAIILLVSLFFGKMILDAFSISLNSFRVAGGFLIISIAFTMISGRLGEHKQNKEEKQTDVSEYDNIGVVPLAMPMMAGPGAIGSTIVWGSNYSSFFDHIGFACGIVIFATGSYVLLRFSAPVVKKLGKTGTNVITRIMGLILMSLGIEFVVTGVRALFPILATGIAS